MVNRKITLNVYFWEGWLMADLPFMMMNWSRFFADSKVAMLPTEAQGVYVLMLGKMWLNQGWLSADDRVLARILGLDVRAWRRTYKPLIEPLLRREIDRHIGAIYTQKHLQEVRTTALASVERMAASTARARAAKAAKHGKVGSATEPKHDAATAPASEPAPEPVAASTASTKPQPQEKEALLPNSRELLSLSPTVDDTALPPRANGQANGSAGTGSRGLGGRSPPQPSEKVEVPPMRHGDIRSEPIRPSPALLNTPLVKRARTGLMAALDSEEDD
jgi:uncharacterized protein YdaU (DUF1376 family)